MVGRRFTSLDDPESLRKLEQLKQNREAQETENTVASLNVVQETPARENALDGPGAAARDFNKPRGEKKGQPRRIKPEKVETQGNVKTEEEIAKELEGIKTQEEDLLSYLGSLKGSINIKGCAYSFPDYLLPRAQKIFGGEIPPAAMEVASIGKKIKEIIEKDKDERKKVLDQIAQEQKIHFEAMLAQIQEYEAPLVAQIESGVYNKLKDVSRIYIFTDSRHQDEIKKLSKEQRAIIKKAIKEANGRISAAVKVYQDKVDQEIKEKRQEKKAERDKLIEEYADKLKTSLFDAEGNWMHIQEFLDDGKVRIISGKKADAKGVTSHVTIAEAVELLGQHTIVPEKRAPESIMEDSGAASPDSRVPENNLEEQKKLIRQKIENKFSEIFDWDKIEGKLQKLYASRARREKFKNNELVKMKEKVLSIAEADEWHAKFFSEEEMNKVIMESFSRANEEINNKKGNLKFLKLINEICTNSSGVAGKRAGAENTYPGMEKAPATGGPSPEEELEEITEADMSPLEDEVSGVEKTETGKQHEETLGAEGISEERLKGMREGISKLKSELVQLKVEMEEAKKAYLGKKNSNSEHLKNFLSLFKKEANLGQSDLEETGLKLKYEGKRREYEEKLTEIEALENELKKLSPESGEAEDSEEKIMAETEKEISALPENERLKMGQVLNSLGFYLEEAKNKFFVQAVESATKNLSGNGKHLAERGSFARFLNSLGKGFKKDEEKARENIEKIKKGDSKKASNALLLSGNALRYGRAAADFTTWAVTSPLRYYMMGAMALARGFDAGKEARLSSEKAIDKTRIKDIDAAAEIAWNIYNEAKVGKETVSKEELEKAYEQNIPKDLLNRLNQYAKDDYSLPVRFIQSTIRWDVKKLTERINKKIETIDKDKSLTKEFKQKEKDKIFEKYSDYIKSFDRLVTQCGTVDVLAMGAQYLKTGARAAVFAVTAETLALLGEKVIESAPQALNEIEKLLHQTASNDSGFSEDAITVHKGEPGFPIEGREPSIGLQVEEGSSPEGTIIKKLEQLGMSHENAGIKAHLMADKYAKEHGLTRGFYDSVRPGTRIELSPDGSRITEVTGEHMGYLPEKEIPTDIGHEAVPEAAPEPAMPKENIVPPAAVETRNDAPDFEVPSNGTGEYIMDPETVNNIDRMDLEVKNLTGQLEDLDDKILKISSGQYEGMNIWPNPETMLEDLTRQKQILEAAKEELTTRIYAGHVGSLRKFFSGGVKEKWLEIGKMRAWDMLENRESVAHKFYDRILESNSKDMIGLKEHISPAREETVDAWVIRVAKTMRKLGIKRIN